MQTRITPRLAAVLLLLSSGCLIPPVYQYPHGFSSSYRQHLMQPEPGYEYSPALSEHGGAEYPLQTPDETYQETPGETYKGGIQSTKVRGVFYPINARKATPDDNSSGQRVTGLSEKILTFTPGL